MSTSTSVPSIRLNNGVTIPAIDDLDTEGTVGEAIRESGIPREEIFITSKLDPSNHDNVAKSFEDSLAALGFLIHWPQATPNSSVPESEHKNPDGSWKVREDITFHESWAELEKLLETGKVRAIGVSNFSVKTLEELAKTAKVTPAVNQVELHPYLVQEGLREYCDEKGIILEAYTPSGYDTVRKDPVIVELAEKYNVNPNQITLAWHLARNIVALPKSHSEEHQRENINVLIVQLAFYP
ncbi:hypothetical protein H0H92_007639 [Tricholoma furcatifolium]|nr:hypothetical protein H0H92_007639 [Tricholoma furcatifolium]